MEREGLGEAVVGRCMSSYVDQGSTESHRYYLSRRTAMEMLRDRGFSVPASDLALTLPEFRVIHGPIVDYDRLRFSVTHRSDPSKRIMVIFRGHGVVKVNDVRSIASQIVNKDSLTGLILILQNQMTNPAQKALDLLPFKVEIFQITDLLVNITKHVLKPKHRILTDEEKQKLLKKHSIQETQLPRMSRKDAIARYYGLERGQVVKVTYSSEITKSHITYRCVW
ncbi:DNA-directed RNA polymerase V subunit 5A [Ziziphus jujuba]|uniref:DNA-directed RNA polymerase V subunit 5A-like n=1 Tax=Ziziphus jujuba TaxID=326968 RepID=A0A6P3Z6B7_ZIZJJ|nr:DNA-directed RNA polymerase V subunit 5A [Ziziphus jujuba]